MSVKHGVAHRHNHWSSVISLVKSTTDGCPVELVTGDTYSYTVTFSNAGASPPIERNIMIDGGAQDGVLIEDRLPSDNASLVATPTPVFLPSAARLIVQTEANAAASGGSASEFWTNYSTWNGTDAIVAIGLLVDSADLEPAESGSLSWQMQIDAEATAGA